MATPKMTRPEVIAEFCAYAFDVAGQPPGSERDLRMKVILEKLWDTAVRITTQTLTPEDENIAAWSNEQLVEALRVHTYRQGGIRNGIFDKILEAADRLEKIDVWEKARGMAPGATGDLSSEDFVRQMRSEWER